MQLVSLLALSSVWSFASSTVVNLDKRESPLSLTLSMVGNTKVQATLSNTGSTDLKVLNKGTFLDSAPVEKVRVYTDSSQVEFKGIRYSVLRTGLSDSAFTVIPAQQSVNVEFDLAELHDVTAGGDYTIATNGALPYAELGSNDLANDALSYSSNTLNIKVDGKEAAAVKFAIDKLKARTYVGSDCSSSQRSAITAALSNCASLASAAADAAASGSASKFQEYFKTTSSSARSTVAARLRAVANECSSTNGGATQTHCTDTYGGCDTDVIAYTVPSANYIVYCSIYFDELPNLTSTCHGQDESTTTIHESTHAPGVYSPGTQDYAYGYSGVRQLSSNADINNADTYALYSNAIYLGC